MIRVLHYGMSPNLGGIETYLLNLSRSVDATRLHFDFLYSDQGREPVFASDLAPGGSCFYGVTPRRKDPRRNRRDLDRLFTEEDIDILHFHANTASYVEPIRAALRHGVRVIVHSHNAGTSRSRLTRTLHAWHQRTLPWDRIARVAVSSEAGRWMFGDRSFQVVHNGIDVDKFAFDPVVRASVRASLGIDSGAFVVGSIAAFLPAKNHEFLLRVFAEVVTRDPTARLLLVGEGPLEEQVRVQSRHLHLEDAVDFLGRRSDIPGLLSAIDVMLMPSRHEGFPIVVLEAQAAGLPSWISDDVTSEVIVSDSCRRLPLAIGAAGWADELRVVSDTARSATRATLERAGLTVELSAAKMTELYHAIMANPSK